MTTLPDGRHAPRPARSTGRILAEAFLPALLLAAALAGCGGRAKSPAHGAGEPVDVAAATFAPGAASGALVLPARIKAAEEVTVAARLAARLTALDAREGDHVRRGEPLARFEAPETRRALAAARAEAAAAELALAVASRQAARIESLFAARVVSQRDLDVAQAERRGAEARLEAARAHLDALETGAVVRAPFDGVVVRRHADPGADLAPGAPLLDLRSSAGVEALVDLPEGAVERAARGPLRVQVGDGPWRAARLVRLDGMTDWRTRTRTARLAIEGPAPEPGAYARVAVGGDAGAGDASVPAAALVRRGALAGVYVIEDGHARLRWLKLGRAAGGRVEVLAGLAPGEAYALEPGALADGRPVRVAAR